DTSIGALASFLLTLGLPDFRVGATEARSPASAFSLAVTASPLSVAPSAERMVRSPAKWPVRQPSRNFVTAESGVGWWEHPVRPRARADTATMAAGRTIRRISVLLWHALASPARCTRSCR